MTENPSSQELINVASDTLRNAITECEPSNNIGSLIVIAQTVWTEVNSDQETHTAIEQKIRQLRMTMNSIAQIDISKGDPIHKRYNPYLWLKNVPKDCEGKINAYIIDKSNSLLSLLQSVARKQE